MPSTLSKRGAGFGYGSRTRLPDKGVPPPNSYQNKMGSIGGGSARGFSFGISREAYSKVFLKEHPGEAATKGIPGPGSYKIGNVTGSEGAKFSMRPKTTNHRLISTARESPGPGAYDFKASVTG